MIEEVLASWFGEPAKAAEDDGQKTWWFRELVDWKAKMAPSAAKDL